MSEPITDDLFAQTIPQEHLDQLDQIDQTYWWHRVRWRVLRHCLRRFARGRPFACYFDIGSGGGGLPGLLVRDFSFGRIVLFDQHAVKPSKIAHSNVEQRFINLETFRAEGLPTPDVITCSDVLEHLDNPGQLLRGLKEASRGHPPILLVTVPAHMALWSTWDKLAGHRRRYQRRELCSLLAANGWTVSYCAYLFHAATIPLLVRRKARADAAQRLEFPPLPPWLNWLLEQLFWWEYRLTGWFRVPFGTSLIAVAQ